MPEPHLVSAWTEAPVVATVGRRNSGNRSAGAAAAGLGSVAGCKSWVAAADGGRDLAATFVSVFARVCVCVHPCLHTYTRRDR